MRPGLRSLHHAFGITVMLAGLIASASAHSTGSTPRRCGSTHRTLTPAQVVDAQFAAYNRHDLDAFAACYADNVSMRDLSGRHPAIQGQASLRKAFAYLAKPGKRGGVQIVKRVVNGPIVVDKEHPLATSSGKPLPDLIAVYEVRGGKIVNVWFPPSP